MRKAISEIKDICKAFSLQEFLPYLITALGVWLLYALLAIAFTYTYLNVDPAGILR